ncbi:MAG: hypothetical protein WD492_05930 [Alkalispirochaeta sp.]
MMTENEFWRIVAEIGWPEADDDEAKYQFMKTYPPAVAEQFSEIFGEKKRALRRAGGVQAVCDSWDDTLAHIVGLGREEWQRNMDHPHLMVEREEALQYRESFAYCIPFADDYLLLTDEGYEPYLRSIQDLVEHLKTTNPDTVPPREFRRYPEILHHCAPFLAGDWPTGVSRYRSTYGPGYADGFPTGIGGYVLPNLVQTLEKYRLRELGAATLQRKLDS